MSFWDFVPAILAATQNEREKGVVYFVRGYPYCREHGAMNKVSKHGMWRCLMCHVGYNEQTKQIFKDSSEGFREK